MDLRQEYFACLALKHTKLLGPAVWKQLFAHYPSAYDALQDAAAWVARGISGRGIGGIVKRCLGESWREKAELEFREATRAGMDVVTWFDPRFPEQLKELPDPPAMLYVAGDVTLLRNICVAVVGARECTRFGLDAAGRISTQLAHVGITVVSGLALGIDRQAHLGALKGIGRSIGVLGCGLDVVYPPGNSELREAMMRQGLLVSEFGPGTEPLGRHFPVRNRIISGLSMGVLVAEAAQRSGSLITARLAAEQGREVFALPGPIGQPTFTGCHRLIKQGAALVEDAEDILEILRHDFRRELADVPAPGPVEAKDAIAETEIKVKAVSSRVGGRKQQKTTPKAAVPRVQTSAKRATAVEREAMDLSPEEWEAMRLIGAGEKIHIDALGRQLQWDSSKVSRVLIMLEMRGAVQQLPGMWYLAKES